MRAERLRSEQPDGSVRTTGELVVFPNTDLRAILEILGSNGRDPRTSDVEIVSEG